MDLFDGIPLSSGKTLLDLTGRVTCAAAAALHVFAIPLSGIVSLAGAVLTPFLTLPGAIAYAIINGGDSISGVAGSFVCGIGYGIVAELACLVGIVALPLLHLGASIRAGASVVYPEGYLVGKKSN